MKIKVYCDESHPDIFSSKKLPYHFLGIGSIWTSDKDSLKEEIHRLRNEHKIGGEFKWNKVSPSRIDFYLELVDLFFKTEEVKFRAIIVDRNKIDLAKYHENDAELGFYKMYYQMLVHRIIPGNDYHIFVDYKKNRVMNRVAKLQDCLRNGCYAESVTVQAIHSHESVIIQLADVLTSAITAKYNKSIDNTSSKMRVIQRIESHSKIEAKQSSETKFNIFCLNPGKREMW